MHAELRSDADEIWVIDCSPEGHQPAVRTRIFQCVQQPVCIVMALRNTDEGSSDPARGRYRALPMGHRDDKFTALGTIALDDSGWTECSSESRASFFPRATGAWADFAPLEVCSFKVWMMTMGSGRVGPGRSLSSAPLPLTFSRFSPPLARPDLTVGAAPDVVVEQRLADGVMRAGQRLRACAFRRFMLHRAAEGGAQEDLDM